MDRKDGNHLGCEQSLFCSKFSVKECKEVKLEVTLAFYEFLIGFSSKSELLAVKKALFRQKSNVINR